MKKFLLLASIISIAGCQTAPQTQDDLGTLAWQHRVEKKVGVITPSGHGPEVGSGEWCNAVEFRLFNRQSGLKPCSPEWNQKVEQTLNP